MATLIKAKAKGKFRPCRADVPKRKVLYADDNGNLATGHFAYGDKVPGLKLLSVPSAQCDNGAVVRSGVGTAHHLRRFPVYLKCVRGNAKVPKRNRIDWMIGWIVQQFPDAKPKVDDYGRIKVVLWADEAKRLRETIRGGWLVQEEK